MIIEYISHIIGHKVRTPSKGKSMFYLWIFPNTISKALWLSFLQELEKRDEPGFCHRMWRLTESQRKQLNLIQGSVSYWSDKEPSLSLANLGMTLLSVPDEMFLSLEVSETQLSADHRESLPFERLKEIKAYQWVRLGKRRGDVAVFGALMRKVQNLYLLALPMVNEYKWEYYILDNIEDVISLIAQDTRREPDLVLKNLLSAADACGDWVPTD